MLPPHPPVPYRNRHTIPTAQPNKKRDRDGVARVLWAVQTLVREACAPLNILNYILGVLLWSINHTREALATVLVVTVNLLITAIQLTRAQYTLHQMQQAFQSTLAVWRSGALVLLPPAQILVGDVLMLRPGDRIPADVAVLQASELLVDMSSRTGESEPHNVEAGMSISQGCMIRSGAAWVVCVQPISNASFIVRQTTRPTGTASMRLERIVRGAAVAAGILSVLTICWGWLHGADWSTMVTVVTVVAGLIPNALVLFATLAHANAGVALSRRGVIVNRPAAIETFAAVDVVCFDKTGTLTTNTLSVADAMPLVGSREAFIDTLGRYVAADGAGNQSSVAIAQAFPRVPMQVDRSTAFDSTRKWSSISNAGLTYVLGAPDTLIPTLQPEWRAQTMAAVQQRARVLLLIQGDADWSVATRSARPLGYVLLRDQIRPGTTQAIKDLTARGVRLAVLSGDDPATVAEVAETVGIPTTHVIHSNNLDSRATQLKASPATIIGRMLPHQKQDVVRAFQAHGGLVGFVGDGFNDVSALQTADVGIAFAAAQTVVRDSADLVILIDDLAILTTIVDHGQSVRDALLQIGDHVLWRVTLCAVIWVGTLVLQLPVWSPLDSTAIALLGVALPSLVFVMHPIPVPARRRDRHHIGCAVLLGFGGIIVWWFVCHVLLVTDVAWLTAIVIMVLWIRVAFRLIARSHVVR